MEHNRNRLQELLRAPLPARKTAQKPTASGPQRNTRIAPFPLEPQDKRAQPQSQTTSAKPPSAQTAPAQAAPSRPASRSTDNEDQAVPAPRSTPSISPTPAPAEDRADKREHHSPPVRTQPAPRSPRTNATRSATTLNIAQYNERPRPSTSGELEDAILASKQAFVSLALFSCIINVLMLAGPLFMLQVYDRVISSGSLPTLVALTIMTACAYAIIGALEIVRSRVIVRVGRQIDTRIGNRIFDAAIKASASGAGKSNGALRELDGLRQFVGSPGPLAFFDAPWTPVYLLVIFLTHWTLGLAATLGAGLLFALAWFSETYARAPLKEAGATSARSLEIAETGQRNAETIIAMGMGPDYRALWSGANRSALDWQLVAADRLGTMSAMSRTLRLLMQSLMLALGAWLAIAGEITAGAIIATTIIFGRALAPVEQAISHWRPFIKALESFASLTELLRKLPPERPRTTLPRPLGHLEVEGLRVASPETRQLILNGAAFSISPGQMLAVIGPSASGKSTLVRALTGLWPPFSGSISIDGARIDQWHPDDLGSNIGYLPQTVELFSGTVRQNIARFSANTTDDEVVSAAKAAHAHDLILALPKGYDTELGAFGTYVSGGQRQRIALARALFRNPPLVILDEPNANLDRDGDVALSSAIDDMRARGQTIILVSHRVQAIGRADLLLLMEGGQQRAFGPRDAVLTMLRSENVAQPGSSNDAPPSPTAKAPTLSASAAPRPDASAITNTYRGAQ